MDGNIITAIITGVFSVLAVAITNMSSNRRNEASMRTQQAVTDEKIAQLTDEVRKHNNFASRIPALEKDVEYIKEEMRELKDKRGG